MVATKKIRVTLLSNDLVVGGAQRLVIDQLELLDRDIFDLTVVVLSQLEEKGTFYDLVPEGIQVYKLNFKGFSDVRSWLELMRVFHTIRPQLVKSSLFFSNTIAWVLKPFFGYTVIAAEHNTLISKTRLQVMANRIGTFLNYTMVVDSKKVASFLAETEGIRPTAFTVIYNGVDLESVEKNKQMLKDHRLELRRSFGIEENAFVFLTVARITKQKNHHLMVEAFAESLTKKPNAQLLIVGDGELLAPLREYVKSLNLEGKVVFTGERHDVHTFYSISDAFMVTSRHEGFCIAAMEGLAFGMPLLSTKVAGIEEYLRDGVNGYFTGDVPSDIAQKMVLVQELVEKDPNHFVEAGLETARQYSKERYGEVYNELFLKAANAR